MQEKRGRTMPMKNDKGCCYETRETTEAMESDTPRKKGHDEAYEALRATTGDPVA
jgi:hypothetical protein